jgi:hypothetical protein
MRCLRRFLHEKSDCICIKTDCAMRIEHDLRREIAYSEENYQARLLRKTEKIAISMIVIG